MTVDKVNYGEYILTSHFQGHQEQEEHSNININIDPSSFEKKKTAIHRACKHKCFEKEWTRYIIEDLTYEVYATPKEIKTYRLTQFDFQLYEDQHVAKCLFLKEKIPYFMFPSTNKLNAVIAIQSTIYRMHNHVYINFERHTFKNNPFTNLKIFVNVNRDSYADGANLDKIVEDAIRLLQ